MIKSPEEINHHGAKVKAPQKMRVITEQSHLGLPSLIRIKVYLNSFIHKVANNHIAWPATHLAKSPISDDALVCHWITRTLLLCIGSEHWGEWIGGVQDWWLLSDCSRVESWTLQLSTYCLSLSFSLFPFGTIVYFLQHFYFYTWVVDGNEDFYSVRIDSKWRRWHYGVSTEALRKPGADAAFTVWLDHATWGHGEEQPSAQLGKPVVCRLSQTFLSVTDTERRRWR